MSVVKRDKVPFSKVLQTGKSYTKNVVEAKCSIKIVDFPMLSLRIKSAHKNITIMPVKMVIICSKNDKFPHG